MCYGILYIGAVIVFLKKRIVNLIFLLVNNLFIINVSLMKLNIYFLLLFSDDEFDYEGMLK
jgi:hypothetical protein